MRGDPTAKWLKSTGRRAPATAQGLATDTEPPHVVCSLGVHTGRTGRVDDSSGSAIDQNRVGRATGVAHGTPARGQRASVQQRRRARHQGTRCCGRAHEACGATVRYRFRNPREQQPGRGSESLAQDTCASDVEALPARLSVLCQISRPVDIESGPFACRCQEIWPGLPAVPAPADRWSQSGATVPG